MHAISWYTAFTLVLLLHPLSMPFPYKVPNAPATALKAPSCWTRPLASSELLLSFKIQPESLLSSHPMSTPGIKGAAFNICAVDTMTAISQSVLEGSRKQLETATRLGVSSKSEAWHLLTGHQ